MLETKLRYRCPRCGGKLAPVDAMESATINVRRTCRRCSARFSLTVVPRQISAGWMHIATITEISYAVEASR